MLIVLKIVEKKIKTFHVPLEIFVALKGHQWNRLTDKDLYFKMAFLQEY